VGIKNKKDMLLVESTEDEAFLKELNPSIDEFIDNLNLKNEAQFKAFLKKMTKYILRRINVEKK